MEINEIEPCPLNGEADLSAPGSKIEMKHILNGIEGQTLSERCVEGLPDYKKKVPRHLETKIKIPSYLTYISL